MHGQPDSPWGKLLQDEYGAVLAWHPLIDHCADVAAVCAQLLESSVLRRRFARLCGVEDLPPAWLARLCYLAALHDAGKVNHGFWRKAQPGARDVEGHVGPLFEAMCSDEPGLARSILTALRLELLESWGAQDLLFASLAHHGRPVRLADAGRRARPALWRAESGRDPIASIAALTAAALHWFPEALAESEPFPERPELSHAFAGLVTWADWIASDASLFPFSERGDPERIERARTLAVSALRKTGIDPEGARAALARPFAWSSVFDFAPRAAQRAVINLPPSERGSLVVLEADTGSGKTEAALAHFLALYSRGGVDGLYFALPTRTAATQLHARVHAAVTRAFPREARPPVILAVPGYLRVDDAIDLQGAPRLAPFAALWPDVSEAARWRAWAAEMPKRYLAGAIAIGTVDQVLLSGLAVKHAHLRATALLRQLLVVDEVHASDTYMTRLAETVIDRHLQAGGHALLMSATLGGAVRERLLTGRRRPPSLAECEAEPYPAVVSVPADDRRRRVPYAVHADGPERSRQRAVRFELAPLGDDPAAIAALALDAAARGAKVIVVRNRVADAIETQRALEAAPAAGALRFCCGEVPAPHHSRFTKEDRTALDEALERAFGKERPEGGRVVVATQTVQQSLDLDADLILSDLCPMDVLLQRLGRLHRHQRRSRPTGFAEPRAFVLTPADRDLGSFLGRGGSRKRVQGLGSVYPDLRIIEATWRELERHSSILELPLMNRRLVERTTHPEALRAIVDELQGEWVTHGQQCDGKGLAQAGQAAQVSFRWDAPYAARSFSREVEAIASTRLGAGDRMVVFAEPFATAFGQRSSAIAIPGWLVPGLAEDAEPQDVVRDMGAGQVQFRLGTKRFAYDHLGLRVPTPEAGREREEHHG